MDVRLVPMTDEEYGPFIERLIPEYAADHAADGRWSLEESLAGARKEVERLLPQGKATATERFLTIVAGTPEEKVGYIWVHFQKQNGFIYDLWVDEHHRRKGYARAGMLALRSTRSKKGPPSWPCTSSRTTFPLGTCIGPSVTERRTWS